MKAARRVGREGCVAAFEASPVLIDILKYHRLRNRLPQILVVDSAASESDADQAVFYLLNSGLSSRNSLVIGRQGLPFLESEQPMPSVVSTLKLDTFCEVNGLIPDMIKIDVEGAEGMVLRGALQSLRQFRPVLVVSMHPYWFPASESVEATMDLLASIGYRIADSRVVRWRRARHRRLPLLTMHRASRRVASGEPQRCFSKRGKGRAIVACSLFAGLFRRFFPQILRILSSLKATNRLCRKWPSSVHSTNSVISLQSIWRSPPVLPVDVLRRCPNRANCELSF